MAGLDDILMIDRLPAVSTSITAVIPLLANPETDWDALEKAVRQDEALAAAILRLANSAMYGAPGRNFDLRTSMTRLGRDQTRQCILDQEMSNTMSGDNAAFGLQRGALQRSSLAGALAAESLANEFAPDQTGLAYIGALLRDIGKLALNLKFGVGYFNLIASHGGEEISFVEAERAAIGVDHAQVGAALARKWRLPPTIIRAIQNHHEPEADGPDHDVVSDIVHAADSICRWAGFGLGIDGMEYRIAPHVCQAFNLDRRTVEREIAQLWDSLRDAEKSLGRNDCGLQGDAA